MRFSTRLHSILAAGALATLSTVPANGADIIVDGTVEANSVDYIFFTFGGGELDILTEGIIGPSGFELSDPTIRLFADNGSPVGALTGDFLVLDDDGGPGVDSLISGSFGSGSYVLAVGSFFLDESEARSGLASSPSRNQDYRTTFTTLSSFSLEQTAPVPEPATWLMLLLGFFGLGAFMRSEKHRERIRSFALA